MAFLPHAGQPTQLTVLVKEAADMRGAADSLYARLRTGSAECTEGRSVRGHCGRIGTRP